MNYILDQMNLTDTNRKFPSPAAENTFFSSTPRSFSRIVHTTGHKTSLSQFKNIAVIKDTWYDFSSVKLEIINKRKTREGMDM